MSARVVPLPGADRPRENPSPPARAPSLLLAGMESINAIALVADDALQVLHANVRGLEAGVAPGQPLAEAMARLREHFAGLAGGDGKGAGWSLSIKRIELPDFGGFVASVRARSRGATRSTTTSGTRLPNRSATITSSGRSKPRRTSARCGVEPGAAITVAGAAGVLRKEKAAGVAPCSARASTW